jgi:hypothetical protein
MATQGAITGRKKTPLRKLRIQLNSPSISSVVTLIGHTISENTQVFKTGYLHGRIAQ